MSGRRRLLVPTLLAIMASSLLAGIWLSQQQSGETTWGSAPPEVQAVMWPEPLPLDDFALETQHGEPFGPESLRGQWSFMFFGYLQCPDVCPNSLYAMREMRQFLEEHGSEEAEHQYIFVSVDPDNDTPELMREYLSWYDPDFIGLHGEGGQVEKLARAMAVKYQEFVDDNGYRSIDHTSSLMIIDPSGRAVGALPPPLQPQRMAEQFQRLRRFIPEHS